MKTKTLAEFEDFAIDHLKHFNAIPCYFDDSQGNSFEVNACWYMASKLQLLKHIK